MKREEIKAEVLQGVKNKAIYCTDFNHCIEDSNRTTSQQMFIIDTDNFHIELDLVETMLWRGYDDGDSESIEVYDMNVYKDGTLINIYYIADDEILNAINY